MRLTCPNCGARYEVDDALIPPAGREVQCSNCSGSWFQTGRAGVQPAPAVAAPRARDAADTPRADETAAAPLRQTPPRRELDPALRTLLREEAEREENLRRQEAQIFEQQEEMPLSAPNPSAASGGSLRKPRADLLPDIEEINASLSRAPVAPDAVVPDIAPAPPPRRTADPTQATRRGQRIGLTLTLGAALLAGLAYAFAPQIIALLPQAEPYLTAYIAWADVQRLALEDLMRLGLERLAAILAAI